MKDDDAVSRGNGDSAATGRDVLQLKQGPVVVLSNRSVLCLLKKLNVLINHHDNVVIGKPIV